MANQAPQFTPAGGEGSVSGNYTYTGGQWNPNPSNPSVPPTTQPTIQPHPIITTGSSSAMQFAKDSQQLNQMIGSLNVGTNPQMNPSGQNPQAQQAPSDMLNTYSDPYTQALDKLSANSDKATQNLISTIKANKTSREANINSEYDRLKAGLMSLGLSTERMNFTPDLVYGSIMQAENQKAAQLQELDQKEATALLEAKNASDEKDFSLLKDKMAYLKDIKNQRLEVLKNTYDTMSYESKIGEMQATQIYDQLQKLPQSRKTEFLQAVASKFNIPLTALTSKVSELAQKKAKGIKSTKSSGTSTNSKLNSSKGISLLTPKFESNKGDDGYVDPSEWTKARTIWMSQGLSKSAFDSNFKQYLNPESYSLAGFTVKK